MKPKSAMTDELRKRIELRAYLIWESEGRPHGREKEHWHRAEAEILGAKPAKKPAKGKADGKRKAGPAAKTKPARTSKTKSAKRAET